MLRVLKTLLGVELDLTELEVAGEALEEKVDAAMLENPELRDYVEQLDIVEEPVARADRRGADGRPAAQPPDPAEIMRELEEILSSASRSSAERPRTRRTDTALGMVADHCAVVRPMLAGVSSARQSPDS